MPIRRLSMKAQVMKTYAKKGKVRRGPGNVGRPRKSHPAVLQSETSKIQLTEVRQREGEASSPD
jgi:hypothetical protein